VSVEKLDTTYDEHCLSILLLHVNATHSRHAGVAARATRKSKRVQVSQPQCALVVHSNCLSGRAALLVPYGGEWHPPNGVHSPEYPDHRGRRIYRLTRGAAAGEQLPALQGQHGNPLLATRKVGTDRQCLAGGCSVQIVVLDKLDYCASLRNLETVSDRPNFKVGRLRITVN